MSIATVRVDDRGPGPAPGAAGSAGGPGRIAILDGRLAVVGGAGRRSEHGFSANASSGLDRTGVGRLICTNPPLAWAGGRAPRDSPRNDGIFRSTFVSFWQSPRRCDMGRDDGFTGGLQNGARRYGQTGRKAMDQSARATSSIPRRGAGLSGSNRGPQWCHGIESDPFTPEIGMERFIAQHGTGSGAQGF